MSSEVSNQEALTKAVSHLAAKRKWLEESILIDSIREGADAIERSLTYDEAWVISAYVMRDLDVNAKEGGDER